VVSSPFLPHKLAVGYSNPAGHVVTAVNRTPSRTWVIWCKSCETPATNYSPSILPATRRGSGLRAIRRLAATEEILTDNGIRAQGSPDTLKVGARSRSALACPRQPLGAR